MSEKAQSRRAKMGVKTIWITENDNNRLRNLIKGIKEFEISGGLTELEAQLDQAKVVGSDQIPENVVTMNCIVRLQDLDTLEETEHWLRFSRESKSCSHVVPILSDLGIALLGSKEGDSIEWAGPSGRKRNKIIEIIYQPERLGNYEL